MSEHTMLCRTCFMPLTPSQNEHYDFNRKDQGNCPGEVLPNPVIDISKDLARLHDALAAAQKSFREAERTQDVFATLCADEPWKKEPGSNSAFAVETFLLRKLNFSTESSRKLISSWKFMFEDPERNFQNALSASRERLADAVNALAKTKSEHDRAESNLNDLQQEIKRARKAFASQITSDKRPTATSNVAVKKYSSKKGIASTRMPVKHFHLINARHTSGEPQGPWSFRNTFDESTFPLLLRQYRGQLQEIPQLWQCRACSNRNIRVVKFNGNYYLGVHEVAGGTCRYSGRELSDWDLIYLINVNAPQSLWNEFYTHLAQTLKSKSKVIRLENWGDNHLRRPLRNPDKAE